MVEDLLHKVGRPERLRAIMRMLKDGKKPSTFGLRALFGVSEMTVLNDVKYLKMLGKLSPSFQLWRQKDASSIEELKNYVDSEVWD